MLNNSSRRSQRSVQINVPFANKLDGGEQVSGTVTERATKQKSMANKTTAKTYINNEMNLLHSENVVSTFDQRNGR